MAGEALREKARQKASGESTEVAVADQKNGKDSIEAFLSSMEPALAKALPRHMTASRMTRIALTQIRLNPDLARCNPQSFAGALMTAAQLGLEPGVNGEAYLVPYGKECTLIVGYQGYAKLFWQHPMAAHIDAQAVYEKDDFDYAYGLNPFLRHKPQRGDRGEVIFYYAVAQLTSGASSFVVLTPEQVKALRNGKVGPSGNIKDPMRWMERKTAVRQLVKMLPKSPELAQAVVADELAGSELHARGMDRPIAELTAQPAEVAPAGVDPATGEYDPTMDADYQPEGEQS